MLTVPVWPLAPARSAGQRSASGGSSRAEAGARQPPVAGPDRALPGGNLVGPARTAGAYGRMTAGATRCAHVSARASARRDESSPAIVTIAGAPPLTAPGACARMTGSERMRATQSRRPGGCSRPSSERGHGGSQLGGSGPVEPGGRHLVGGIERPLIDDVLHPLPAVLLHRDLRAHLADRRLRGGQMQSCCAAPGSARKR